MIGIIDIGTNTIRLVTYKDNDEFSNYAVRSEIIRDSEDNRLTKTGVENLCNSIKYLISKTPAEKIYAFATHSVRKLENKEEIIEEIYKGTGIKPDILTGEEEAECVFLGVINEIKENEGIIIDLGGGSAEIIGYKNEKIIYLKSFSIGSKVIKNQFSNEIIPTEKEIENIKTYLKEIIEKIEVSGNLYFTGGTAKTAHKLHNIIDNDKKAFLDIHEINEVFNYIEEKSEEELKELLKSRYDTMAVGLIIIKTLAEIYNRNEIYIVKSGLREGYMKKRNEI